jgi:hypothetical protein
MDKMPDAKVRKPHGYDKENSTHKEWNDTLWTRTLLQNRWQIYSYVTLASAKNAWFRAVARDDV